MACSCNKSTKKVTPGSGAKMPGPKLMVDSKKSRRSTTIKFSRKK